MELGWMVRKGWENTDNLIAIILAIGGISTIFISTVIGGGQHGLGIALLMPSLLYLYINSDDISVTTTPISKEKIVRFLNILFFGLLSGGAVVGVYPRYNRPLSHFVFFSAATTLIVIEIYHRKSGRRRSIFVLSKIIILSIVFRIIRFNNFETMPGSDLHFHYQFTEALIAAEQLPVSEFEGNKYLITSLWHILVSSTHYVTDLIFEDLIIASIVIPFTIVTVSGTYAITRQFVIENEIALLSGLLVSVGDQFILRGVTSITPSSLVIIFTVMVIFLITHSLSNRSISLALLLVFAGILTHQLSTFAMVVIVFSLTLGSGFDYITPIRQISLSQIKSLFYVSVVSLLILFLVWGYGTYSGQTFFDRIILRISRILVGLSERTGETDYTSISEGFVSDLLYTMGYNIVVGFGVFGLLYSLHENNSHSNKHSFIYGFAAATGVLFILIYPLTIVGINQLFIPHRMLVFLQLFAICYAAIGLHILITISNENKHIILVSAIVFIMIFMLLTTPFLNRNTPIYNENRVERSELTEGEISAHIWASKYDTNKIYTDPLVGNSKLQTANVHTKNVERHKTDVKAWMSEPGESVFILREYIANKDEIEVTGTYARSNSLSVSELIKATSENAHIYNNGRSKIVWKKAV